MTDSPHTASNPRNVNGPGILLRQAREQVGISLEDLAAQTKLARGTLDALEQDDFKTLSEPVYVRGYFRKLATVLPVTEASLLAAYAVVVPQKKPMHAAVPQISASGVPVGENSGMGGLAKIGVIMLGLLIGGVAFWSNRNATPEKPTKPTSQVVIAAPVAAPAPVVPMPEDPVVPATNPPATAAPANPAAPVGSTPQPAPGPALPAPAAPAAALPPSASPAPAAATTPAPAVAAARPTPAVAVPPAAASAPVAGSQPVGIQFADDCWVRIKDATGNTLLTGVIKAGEVRSLSGVPPFSVSLGNSQGVTISRNGAAIDMSSYTKGKLVAQFKLP